MVAQNLFFHDFLNDESVPYGISCSALSYREGDHANPWRWALGRAFELELVVAGPDLELRVELLYPGFEQSVRVFVGEKPLGDIHLSEAKRRVPLRVLLPVGERLRLVPDLPGPSGRDQRELALCFGELKLIHGAMAQGKICAMPFTRKEIKGTGAFVPCCSPWLTQDYFGLEEGENSWNGPQARALRESILDGSYRFCRRELCQTQYFAYDELPALRSPAGEFVLSENNLRALQTGKLEMPEGPSAATITADPRCNLACPSCRTEKIVSLDNQGAARVSAAEMEVSGLSGNLARLRIAGDGEPLFSPFLRGLIQSLGNENFPALKIVELHTNGLFLDEKNLRGLEPGSKRINRVFVSIDAGDEETYKRVRGGAWQRLMRNLEWAAGQRKLGRFESLVLLFVYGRDNYGSMPAFARLANSLGVDAVYFSPVLDWERAGARNYDELAVHLPFHPEHEKFLAVTSPLRAMNGIFFS